MTDAHSPENDPKTPGIGRVEIPMPEWPAPDGPVVMHDEFRLIMVDTESGYQAVKLLVRLLQGEEPADMDDDEVLGLATLLEAVTGRLELAVDGLRTMAKELGIPLAGSLAPDM